MLRIYDKQSRFYGFVILETDVPEYPEIEMFVNMKRKMILMNKGAREGARVVKLSF